MTTKQVWTSYSEDLKRFIISKVKDITIADDILQDTFIKIHTKLHTLKDIKKLKSWCFTVARNSILDYWKATNQTFEIANFEYEELSQTWNIDQKQTINLFDLSFDVTKLEPTSNIFCCVVSCQENMQLSDRHVDEIFETNL